MRFSGGPAPVDPLDLSRKGAVTEGGVQHAPSKGMPKLVGDATTGKAGIEAMLDIETITGVAGNIESEFWGFAGKSPDNPENEPST